MAAVSTVILRAMRMVGEKPRGGTLDSNEQTECLAEFNSFVEALNNEKLMCYSVTQVSTALTASTLSYTIGPGGDINVTRPIALRDPCWVRDSSGYDYPLTIINIERYGRLVDKSSGAAIPTAIYYDGGYSATSTATLTLYPPPSASLTLFIHSVTQMQTFASLTTEILFPPGYRLMFESNFAIHLAAGQTPISAETAKIARESKAVIKAQNAPALIARVDPGALVANPIDHSITFDSEYLG